MNASKASTKLFETPQISVKIEVYFILIHLSEIYGAGRVKE